MLKYFKKPKRGRGDELHIGETDCCSNKDNCVDEVDDSPSYGTSISRSNANALKRDSLRSTSSFCDEVFLEELGNLGLMLTSAGDAEEDSVSFSALSLSAQSSGGSNRIVGAAAYSVNALNSIVEFEEDIFKYHSRLSMCVTSIVNEPNCLTYFIQYLEKHNGLPLIKFYLDTENFKNAALAQLRKEQKHKLISEGSTDGLKEPKTNMPDEVGIRIEEEGSDVEYSNVPELKTLCDLTMRKPLTDDEKSQIYAETNKQLTKCNDKNAFKASSEQSLCSLTSNFTEISDYAPIPMASVQDALAIYQKYLGPNSPQYVELPVEILSKISLVLCKQEQDEESSCITSDCFSEAQQFALNKLEKDFLNDFLQSTFYAKYCIELIQGHNLNINDILHSEVTLFYLMEYLEQHQERDCLEFWSSAINFRKSYLSQEAQTRNEKEAQSDAMIIYEKFFSLQTEIKLWSSNKLRSHVESCICAEDLVFYCFDLPLKVAAKYLECKFLKLFLKSSLFNNYLNELKTRIGDESQQPATFSKSLGFHKPLRRCVSEKISNRHRKILSDCSQDTKYSISQQNTLLASMDTHSSHLKQFQLSIDSSQLTNPDLLWQRSNSKHLKFGRVNSLGRYERDFVSPSDALQQKSMKYNHNWSFTFSGNKIKNAVRKLVHLPDDSLQEEIAWQMAEMIVKDVTSVTMGKVEEKIDQEKKHKS